MLTKHYKLISGLIWLGGCIVIYSVTNIKGLIYILWEVSISSLSYLGLAVYMKRVLENKNSEQHHKNIKISAILGAFIVLSFYAMYAFSKSSASEALSLATLFVPMSLPVMFAGFISGGLVYAGISAICKKTQKTE